MISKQRILSWCGGQAQSANDVIKAELKDREQYPHKNKMSIKQQWFATTPRNTPT